MEQRLINLLNLEAIFTNFIDIPSFLNSHSKKERRFGQQLYAATWEGFTKIDEDSFYKLVCPYLSLMFKYEFEQAERLARETIRDIKTDLNERLNSPQDFSE